MYRVSLKRGWKVTQDSFSLTSLHFVIGPGNSHHNLNQSESKLKPIATRPITFLRFNQFAYLILHSHWLSVIFSSFLIGCCDNPSLDFTTLNLNILHFWKILGFCKYKFFSVFGRFTDKTRTHARVLLPRLRTFGGHGLKSRWSSVL